MPMNKKPNGLIAEKSPYLLQHAHNPVNWYPWSEEAFEKAKQENKPIFLSIGYSTCHWCHVMAHESFEDEEVAAYLNEHYVAIKVDREERPDIDSIYMKVCQMMTGQGGWPLTIIMTPDQIPFYAGTYFPKHSRYNIPGLMDVLVHLHTLYQEDPKQITKVTKSVRRALAKTVQSKSSETLTKQNADVAFEQLASKFDHEHGGFGAAPKFPQPHNLFFLLKYYYFAKEPKALEMVEQTLQKMAAGGIYDHIGFGFCRYSTDEQWLVPHFEKMLYDNALLLMAYTECYQVTKNPFYKRIAEQIISFISREMFNEGGGFFTAIDADSEGIEGKYYCWDYEEIFDILGDELGGLFADAYHITLEGNFDGTNIPNLIGTNKKYLAAKYKLSEQALQEQLEIARQKLFSEREKRVKPHVDDKILTGYNALMIAALAKSTGVLQHADAKKMAENGLHFIENELFKDSRLMARFRNGETKYKAYLDDYAFLAWAYLEMYQATFDLNMLHNVKNLLDRMNTLFWDEAEGGFFFSGKDGEKLIATDKEVYDGALPSGNSVAAYVLVKAGFLTGENRYLEHAQTMQSTFYNDLSRSAANAAFFMQSVLLLENPTKEVVIIGDNSQQGYSAWMDNFHATFLPDVTLLPAASAEDFHVAAPFAANYKQIGAMPTVYICENFASRQPTTDLSAAWKELLS